ncbi:MAG: hypothetical protein PQJ50_10305 [Spirochaetales bacterium]|nr:hypothetical protein [Spirochaetales bacterium]
MKNMLWLILAVLSFSLLVSCDDGSSLTFNEDYAGDWYVEGEFPMPGSEPVEMVDGVLIMSMSDTTLEQSFSMNTGAGWIVVPVEEATIKKISEGIVELTSKINGGQLNGENSYSLSGDGNILDFGELTLSKTDPRS